MLFPRVCLQQVLNVLMQVPGRHLKQQQQHGCYAVSQGLSAAGSECAGAGSWPAPKQQHGCYGVSQGLTAAGSECAGAGSWLAPKTTL